MTDPLGHATSYPYDADDRVEATTYDDGAAESIRYDALGRVTSKTDALAHGTEYGYDALGHLVRVSDHLGNVTQYAKRSAASKPSQCRRSRALALARLRKVSASS